MNTQLARTIKPSKEATEEAADIIREILNGGHGVTSTHHAKEVATRLQERLLEATWLTGKQKLFCLEVWVALTKYDE